MTEPPVPQPDDKDWTWVLNEPCPECGFDATALDRLKIPAAIDAAAGAFRSALAAPGAADRSSPQVWSRLEYACQIRDACRVFGTRLHLMLDEDDPIFENWDQDETARAGRYWAQDPVVVAAQMTLAADEIARGFAGVPIEAWDRPGRRSNGSYFTVDTLGRYFTHDLVHHVHDIQG